MHRSCCGILLRLLRHVARRFYIRRTSSTSSSGLCTRVIVLHEGRVVADDSMKQLRTTLASGSLEQVFAHLVLRHDPGRIARDIADVVTVGA